MKISIVVPCYNEAETIGHFIASVIPVAENTGSATAK
jgi:glycosyltransferase involved in cell wall biosynthesis